MSNRRGHTLVEILISSTLLVFTLSLCSVPFIMARDAMWRTGQKVDAQTGIRLPFDRMVRDLQGRYNLMLGEATQTANSKYEVAKAYAPATAECYDTADKKGFQIKYYLEHYRDVSLLDANYKPLADLSGGQATVKLYKLIREVRKHQDGAYLQTTGSPETVATDLTGDFSFLVRYYDTTGNLDDLVLDNRDPRRWPRLDKTGTSWIAEKGDLVTVWATEFREEQAAEKGGPVLQSNTARLDRAVDVKHLTSFSVRN
ncbi:MAG: hypothetical protein FJX76_06040 [Armatimonadetes bacterium]|nr:hypothetical protein [Armatimonadota bacterium]